MYSVRISPCQASVQNRQEPFESCQAMTTHYRYGQHLTPCENCSHTDLGLSTPPRSDMSSMQICLVGFISTVWGQRPPRHHSHIPDMTHPYLAASRAARNTHRCRTETSTEGTAGRGFKGRGDQAPTGWMNHHAQEGHRQTVQQNGVTLHAPCFLISWCSCHGWPLADE